MKKKIFALALVVLFSIIGTTSGFAKSTPDWNKELEKGYRELSIGNKENAAEIFRKKVDKYPNSGACHTALGKALKRLGKLDEAKKEFRTATQVEANFAEGQYEYAVSLENDKQYKEALPYFQQFQTLSPDEARRRNIEDRIRFCQDQN